MKIKKVYNLQVLTGIYHLMENPIKTLINKGKYI